MILSGQTIRGLCIDSDMLYPFCERSVHAETGMSYGLSCAGYDIRLKQGLVLAPHDFALGSTVEHFIMPNNVLAQVADKSTLARKGLSVFNTIIEPGWVGWLTVELVNHSSRPLELLAGQPIAQVVFRYTDLPVEKPYRGKYLFQPDRPVEALRETGSQTTD